MWSNLYAKLSDCTSKEWGNRKKCTHYLFSIQSFVMRNNGRYFYLFISSSEMISFILSQFLHISKWIFMRWQFPEHIYSLKFTHLKARIYCIDKMNGMKFAQMKLHVAYQFGDGVWLGLILDMLIGLIDCWLDNSGVTTHACLGCEWD